MADDLPDEHSDHDYVGPALGRATAPEWFGKRKKALPEVCSVLSNRDGVYYFFRSGGFVKDSSACQSWVCLHSQCINARKTSDCIHVSIAQEYARNTPPEPVQHDPDRHPFPEG